MCDQGTYSEVKIVGGKVLTTIDSCIAPIIQALNTAGIETVASCCGHGWNIGSIALKGGKELLITKDWKEARMIERFIDAVQRYHTGGPDDPR